MRAGRAGAISASKSDKYRDMDEENNPIHKKYGAMREKSYSELELKNFFSIFAPIDLIQGGFFMTGKTKNELSRNTEFQKRLAMRDFPLKLWILGGLIILVALFLLINASIAKNGESAIKSFDGDWWEFFISIVIFLIGISFVIAGRIEVISLDKEVANTKNPKNKLLNRKTPSGSSSAMFFAEKN